MVARVKKTSTPVSTDMARPDVDAEALQQHIATAAYYRAEARAFTPGNELEDWLVAEQAYLS
jgi:hypothetical protein